MMRRLTRRVVIHGVEVGLFVTSWALLGAFAMGNRIGAKTPRPPTRGGYV